MKATRRMITTITTMAMAVSSVPLMAAADNLEVTYNAEPTYTVTIPAGVTLSATDTQTATIEASDVILEKDTAISVKLESASNTESGSTFSAKTTDGASTASYTISKGETAIAVGDEVASFTENGTQNLTFSTATGATAAGSHTETLTFNISVTEPEPEPEIYEGGTLKEGDVVDVSMKFMGEDIHFSGVCRGNEEDFDIDERYYIHGDKDFNCYMDLSGAEAENLNINITCMDNEGPHQARINPNFIMNNIWLHLYEASADDVKNLSICINGKKLNWDVDVW